MGTKMSFKEKVKEIIENKMIELQEEATTKWSSNEERKQASKTLYEIEKMIKELEM